MKKPFGIAAAIFVISIFCFLVYNSKSVYYEADKEFYDHAYFSGEVVKISGGRGTKIFYGESEFFYAGSLANDSVAEIIKIGDVVRKRDSVLEISREDEENEMKQIATVKVKNPGDSYFWYFLGLQFQIRA